MKNFHVLPSRIVVRVKPPPIEQLIIDLFFEMRNKNKFDYRVFVDANGVAVISGEELLKMFDETRCLFLMDYVDPRTNFTGCITAKVLSGKDIEGAIKAFEMYHKYVSYPAGYEEKLRSAFLRGQEPNKYEVEVEAEY